MGELVDGCGCWLAVGCRRGCDNCCGGGLVDCVVVEVSDVSLLGAGGGPTSVMNLRSWPAVGAGEVPDGGVCKTAFMISISSRV